MRVADADRRREEAVHDRPRGRGHADRPQDARRLRDQGIQGHDVGVDRLADEGVGHAVGGDVQGRGHLRIRAGEVEVQGVALHGEGHLDPDRHGRLEIVLHVVVEAVGPVRDLRDRGPRPALGMVQHGVHPLQHRVGAELRDHLLHPPVAGVDGRAHRLDVAPHEIGDPAVVEDDVADVLVEHAGPVELGRPEAQALLEDLGRPGPHAGRHRAPDVGGVDERVAPRDDPVAVEDRPQDVDVGEMRAEGAGQVGVVRDDDVAGLVPVEVVEGVLHVEPEVGGGPELPGVRDVLAAGRDQAGGEVGGLLHEGRVGGALHDARHVLHDGLVVVAEHLEQDAIDRHGSPPPDHEIAGVVHRAGEAGGNDRGRVVLLDDGRPRQAIAGPEIAAPVDQRLVVRAFVVDRPLADRRRRARSWGGRARGGFGVSPVIVARKSISSTSAARSA